MKNFKNQILLSIQKMFSNGIKIIPIIAASLMLFLTSCSTTTTMAQHVSVGVNIRLPFWAPAYEHVDRVRYYYLPDIECYYDVWNQQFAYLEEGNWMFAAQLPPFYAWYDFNRNPFVVVLDWHVHEPWMHHHFYLGHYPRFYYRSVYKSESRPFCGFNENVKTIVYNRNTDVKYTMTERREPVSKEQKVAATHPPQRMEYYGPGIGQPVKVEKQMMRPQQEKAGRK